jgi:TonB family protein
VPRFQLQAPLDVTVLRSGIPDTVPGRSVNVCERGIAAVLAGELITGETVGIEVRLPRTADSLRTRALVRYQDRLRCGLEFVGLSAEQRGTIRDWAKEAKAETDANAGVVPAMANTSGDAGGASGLISASSASIGPTSIGPSSEPRSIGAAPQKPRKKRPVPATAIFLVFLILAAIVSGVLWWRWNRGWEELESGLKNPEIVTAEKVPTQISTEVMEKLLIHRVEPTYPAEARKENLEGIVALDVIVGRDGSVLKVRALNGPQVLAAAAIDALRWWKFEPYRVNGEPAVVETTMAVEFKR